MVRKLAMMTLGTLSLAYVGGAVWLDRHGRRAPARDRYDAIVVLGCRVRPDGTASPALARRTRHAARLYREGLAPRLGPGDRRQVRARFHEVLQVGVVVPLQVDVEQVLADLLQE